MLETFYNYFRTIEMPDVTHERAEKLVREFRSLIGEPIDRVIVTDAYDPQGVRRYHSLWLSHGPVIMECKQFLISDNIDFLNLSSGVQWVELTKTELEDIEGQTTQKSVLRAQAMFRNILSLPGAPGAVLHAVHNNCRYLALFLKEMFVDVLVRGHW
jgi:hypothetical protein